MERVERLVDVEESGGVEIRGEKTRWEVEKRLKEEYRKVERMRRWRRTSRKGGEISGSGGRSGDKGREKQIGAGKG